jgi:molybdopterin-guanine dinucleotide biosynthesis protein A
MNLLVGLFVGGSGSRMGGAAKGLLEAPGVAKGLLEAPGVAKGLLEAPGGALTLLERLLQQTQSALPEARAVLVGDASAYARLELGLTALADEPEGVGPLGGLIALLAYAERAGARHVLALACDLPYLEQTLIARLACESLDADALVAAQQSLKNPLIARYRVEPALAAARLTLAAGRRSLQAVLDRLQPRVALLELGADEEASLDDWDTLSAVTRAR